MRRSTAIAAIATTLALSASVLTLHSASAGLSVTDPLEWSDPLLVTSSDDGLTLADTDAEDDVAVAVVTRIVGEGIGVGSIGSRDANDGTEFDIYTASGSGQWVMRYTIPAATVGTVAGLPRIATDGLGWALIWQREVSPGRWEVVAAQASMNNTDPAIGVITTVTGGYAQLISLALDAAPNTQLVTGPRYLAAWLGKRISTSTAVAEVSEMYSSSLSWERPVTVGTVPDTATGGNLKVAYANNRSAVIGYTSTAAGVGRVFVNFRAAAGEWSGLKSVGTTTSGAWDLDMPESAPTSALVAWAESGRSVTVDQRRLSSGASEWSVDQGAFASSRYIGRVVATDTGGDNVIVSWSEQPSAPSTTATAFGVTSLVIDRSDPLGQDGRYFYPLLFGEQASGPISLDAGMNDSGRYSLAVTARTGAATSTIKAFTAGPGTPLTFWGGQTQGTVIATGIAPRGVVGLLVPPSSADLPRLLWAQASGNATSLQTALQFVAARPPSEPLGVFALPRDQAVEVRWNAPTDLSTGQISYRVTANPGGATCQAFTRACEVTGLTNGRSYTFTVVASTVAGGPGPASAPSAATIPGPEAPSASSVKIRAKKNGRMIAKWGASAGATVTSYVLRTKKGKGSWRSTDVGNTFKKRLTVRPGQKLCVQVASVNAAGDRGAWTPRVCKRGKS